MDDLYRTLRVTTDATADEIWNEYRALVPTMEDHYRTLYMIMLSTPDEFWDAYRALVSTMEDHYRTLGVTMDATADEIRNAYRALVSKQRLDTIDTVELAAALHRLHDIETAWATLGDTMERSRYYAVLRTTQFYRLLNRHYDLPRYWPRSLLPFECRDRELLYPSNLDERFSTKSNHSKDLYEPVLPAVLNGKAIETFPDYGASGNFVTRSFAAKNGLAIDSKAASLVRKANGTFVKTLGSVCMDFSFAGKSKVYQLSFQVLGKCSHPVVLGAHFLKKTETLTRHFASRIKKVLRSATSAMRLCYAGSQSYVSGLLDGVEVDALPDTGSDIMLISAAYARQRGFKIKRDSEYRKTLEYMDGTTGVTSGLVENVEWQYGSRWNGKHVTSFYVVEDLCCDVILSFDFLCETDCFGAYAKYIFDTDSDEDLHHLLIIKEKAEKEPVAPVIQPSTGTTQQQALDQYKAAQQQAANLAPEERRAYLLPYKQRYQALLAKNARSQRGAQVTFASDSGQSSTSTPSTPEQASTSPQQRSPSDNSDPNLGAATFHTRRIRLNDLRDRSSHRPKMRPVS